MKILQTVKLLIVTAITVLLVGCGESKSSADGALRVGTISGPETELMEVAQEVALQKYGVQIEIVTFEDYITPNAALNDGYIDANAFQTQHFFDAMIAQTGYKLVNAGYTFIYPMGVYSNKYKSIKELPEGATIALPNDVSNVPRSLLILADAGLITIKPLPHQKNITLEAITSNPLKLKFIELDASQLPRVLADVDAAVINTNYAIPAGLLPKRDAIYVETVNPIYANIIAVKAGHEKDPRIEKMVEAYQSEEVIERANVLFSGQAIPAWKTLKKPVE